MWFVFILTEHTDSYFAWTIQPFLTAAFLGAGYFSSFLLEFLAARESEWAKGRIAVPAVFIFTTLTLIATVLHADRFHFGSPEPIARFAAWFWLAIYAIVPPAMVAVWIRQWKIRGEDSPRSLALPTSMRIVLSIQAVIMLAVGIGLFLFPNPIASFWPWKLTALTSRAIGAWFIGVGVFAIQSVKENDFGRVKSGLVSYLGLGLLELVALLRYPADIDWTKSNAWIYLLFMLTVFFVGLYGCLRYRRNLFHVSRG